MAINWIGNNSRGEIPLRRFKFQLIHSEKIIYRNGCNSRRMRTKAIKSLDEELKRYQREETMVGDVAGWPSEESNTEKGRESPEQRNLLS